MVRKHKILGGGALALIALITFVAYQGFVYSHNDPCPPAMAPVPASAVAASAQRMKAIMHRCYGPPEILALEEIEKPMPKADEVLVRVHAASANPLDWHRMRGSPYAMRRRTGFGAPAGPRFGVDFAGSVEAVGPDAKTFKPGDPVFGAARGAFGEYVLVRESDAIVPKPANVTFEQAAAVTVAGTTALMALRDAARIEAGQKVLINGASGGVGTFAVQIAKAYGAEVTAVCSARNAGMVRSIGADHVIDYKTQDFTEGPERYDVIVDMISNHSWLRLARVMRPEGIIVIVGDAEGSKWIGSLLDPYRAGMANAILSQELIRLRADTLKEDLEFLRELMQEGKMTPVIDRTYRLAEVPAAIEYLETGRARGKVVIVVGGPGNTSNSTASSPSPSSSMIAGMVPMLTWVSAILHFRPIASQMHSPAASRAPGLCDGRYHGQYGSDPRMVLDTE